MRDRVIVAKNRTKVILVAVVVVVVIVVVVVVVYLLKNEFSVNRNFFAVKNFRSLSIFCYLSFCCQTTVNEYLRNVRITSAWLPSGA